MQDSVPEGGVIPFVITVDVEPDDAWSNHRNAGMSNIAELVRLQELLDRYGAKATLLVTHTVVKDEAAAGIVKRLAEESGAEIGAHLHPWENPPFLPSGIDVEHATYPHELPLESFERKMETLTEGVASRFGSGPTSYRAGRWGLAGEHLRVLERLGYEVDTSVIPLVDWRSTFGIPQARNGDGGPDYRFAPRRPYYPDYADVTRSGEAQIVEWPVTVAFTRRVPGVVRSRYGDLPLIVRRVLRKSGLVRPVWCNPAEQPEERLAAMMAVALGEPAAQINMAFHSSELMTGGSPSTRTPKATRAVFARIERVLESAALSGSCRFETLTSAARAWKQGTERASLRAPEPVGSRVA